MDPIAHTLFGATLAEAGLKRKTALATTTLVIGANLPDIDGLAMLVSSDYALQFRRGWTHGILALMIWPFLLAGAMMGIDRLLQRRKSDQKGPPLHPEWLLAISFIGVWSHPLLDWLNTYGVRLLMPFNDTWFYGDTLFIVDPWFWLLTGAGVVLARSKSKLGVAGWIVLGSALTALVTTAEIPLAAKFVWGVGIFFIAAARWSGRFQNSLQPLALTLLTAAVLYTVFMYTGSRMNVHHARAFLADQGIEVIDIMSNPLPAQPLARTGIAASETHYYLFRGSWVKPESYELLEEPIPIEPPDEIVEAALQSPDVQGLMNWIRFPHYEVQELSDGWRVIIRDLRYVHPEATESPGIGMDAIELDRELDVRSRK
ncbi:MAG: metal-dependent hydrolase [Balneolaceae bacterium]|nr:metal-dependent hydrolase [Balneolaceae bacterium]MCH8548483.1 metal-dependent hydrolase [Balneolaceae bacterium]